MEDLNAEEDELAKILRNELCYPNGIEKNPKECAVIFHKLSLLYKRRYNIEPDKIFLIQSAALMNAALVRKPDNTKTVQNDIQELYLYVLRQANAQTQNNNHLDMVTERVKMEVNEMREWVDDQLLSVGITPDNAEGDELLRLEKEKISKIMMIQEKTTDSYREIMRNLDRCCLDVLGKVPCKYTLAGMGSLSRNEITPYSDFENIIVLEEGAHERIDYEQVLEFFRWFVVIFQLVLINLGETILPSVAIPSLNNFTIKGGDWFFDGYTTRGISFDGLMPHACKSPLGRQLKTEAKPFTTELIKPVSLMLAYLESNEDKKNGYHLAEILSNVCFVSGSRDVYDDFEYRLDKLLEYKAQKEDLRKQIYKQVNEDLDKFATNSNFHYLSEGDEINMKSILYRSTTIFISALGRENNIRGSSFKIIKEVTNRGLIKDSFSHKLLYAVAIACEVRLKLYMKDQSQNDWIDNETVIEDEVGDLAETVGDKCLVDYFLIAYFLQYYVAKHFRLSVNRFYDYPQLLHVKLNCYLDNHEMAINSAKLLVQNINKGINASHLESEEGKSISGLEYFKLQEQLYDLKAIDHNLSIPDNDFRKSQYNNCRKTIADVLHIVGMCLTKQKKFNQALAQSTRELKIRELINQDDSCDRDIAICYTLKATCLSGLNRQKESIEMKIISINILQKLNNYSTKQKDLALLYSTMALDHIGLGEVDQALKMFDRCLAILGKINSTGISKTKIKHCIYVGNAFYTQKNYTLALKYYRQGLESGKQISFASRRNQIIAELHGMTARCFQSMGQSAEALHHSTAKKDIHMQILSTKVFLKNNQMQYQEYLRQTSGTKIKKKSIVFDNICEKLEIYAVLPYIRKGLEIKKNQIPNVLLHKSITLELKNLSISYKNKKKHQESIKLFKSTTENSTDDAIALYINQIGLCLASLGEYEKALGEYQQALDIRKQTSPDVNTDTDIAGFYYNAGVCLQNMKKYKEALEMFENSLEIQKRISTDENTDENVAFCLNEIGVCLNNDKEHEKALEKYQQALDIRKRMSTDVNIDTDIAVHLYNANFCLRNMKKYEEAVEIFENSLEIRKRISTDESTDDDVAFCVNEIGACLFILNEYKKVLKTHQQALDIRKRISPDVNIDTDIAGYLYNAAICLKNMEKYKEALEMFENSLEIRKRISTDESTDDDVASSLNQIGMCLDNAKEHEKALEKYQQALDIKKRISPDVNTDTDIAAYLVNAGICLRKMNKYKEALEMFENSLEIRKRISTDESTDDDVAFCLTQIGICLHNNKEHEKALEKYQQALDITKRISPDVNIDTDIAAYLCNAGDCLNNMKKYKEALEMFENSLEIRKRISTDENADGYVAFCLNQISVCLFNLNEYKKAIKTYQQASEILLQMQPTVSNKFFNFCLNVFCWLLF